ncbi:MAG: MFS transporter, partial [Hornefia butyriciproducens]|nr:MFS transporter [Hornefia butyriciproducens]
MKEKSKLNFGLILTVYLLGIFMGALDTGIVTPARTVIQESLNVGDKAGIWMITVYTLSYAASIPVMGKLADRMGRRTIYLLSIFLFGGGSLFCGLSHGMNSFTALLIARAVQAVGGGGIMPVATAEFGTTFPEEKRGMALGMVGGVYGVANIFGASVGSAVMDFFGTGHWEFIFFVNVPIAVFILAAGFFCLPNTKEKSRDPIDGTGICVLVIMVLCIMYGLKNIDFFNFRETLQSTDVYPYLLIFLALLPIFVWIERRAADPVMNLHYFSNPRILITLGVSIITGIVLMGVIFVPQLCENAMEVPSGKGGYFVIILGVFAGVGAPFSGRLTDRFGPRAVLGAGLIASILGSLTVIFSTTVDPGWPNVIAALMFIGLGIGFTMGAPLNYMMLWETDEREANSALATLSLVRSLGTVIAPAVMVGFIAHAGTGISDDVMKLMPKEVNVPRLPYAAELTKVMRSQGVENVPDFDSMTRIQIDMNASGGDTEIPEALLNELKNSDVTTITENTKDMARYMFEKMSPQIQTKIDRGISKGES